MSAALVEALVRCGFDVEAYINSYDDLKQALKTRGDGYDNFICFAREDTRWFPIELKVEGLDVIAELPIASKDKARIIAALLRSYLTPWSSLWLKPDAEFAAFWTRLIEILSGRFHPYFIVGDSHTQIYSRVFEHRGKYAIPFHVLCLASSARGLISPSSFSGSGVRLSRLSPLIQDAVPKAPIFLKFGQVDVEFVFDFHRIRDKEPAFEIERWRKFTQQSVNRYVKFISGTFQSRPIFLLGIFPPALSDEALAQGYVNDHIVDTEGVNSIAETRAFIASLKHPDKSKRTELHRDFNARLFAAGRAQGFACLDDFDAFLGPAGLIAERFTPNEDHHLGYEASRDVAEATLAIGLDRFAEATGAASRG